MLVLGLETSCDETGVAVYENGRGMLFAEDEPDTEKLEEQQRHTQQTAELYLSVTQALALAVEAKGYEIAAVYGSPEADQATGELIDSIFKLQRRQRLISCPLHFFTLILEGE